MNKCVRINSFPLQIPDVMFLSKTDLNTNCAVSAMTFTNYQLPHLGKFPEHYFLLPLVGQWKKEACHQLIQCCYIGLARMFSHYLQNLFQSDRNLSWIKFDWIMFSDWFVNMKAFYSDRAIRRVARNNIAIERQNLVINFCWDFCSVQYQYINLNALMRTIACVN